MAITQVRQSSFAAGEVSPSFFGRTDFAKFDIGLRKCKNWIVGPQGSAYNRPGTQYIAATKTTGQKVRLIPFQFSDGQSFVLEFGSTYVRFYQNGAQMPMPTAAAWSGATTYAQYDAVTYGGVYYVSRVGGNLNHTPPASTSNTYWIYVGATGGPLEITSPYATVDLPHLKFAQSGDVIIFASQNHPPYRLSRYPSSGWLFDLLPVGETAYHYAGQPPITIGIGDAYWSYVPVAAMDGFLGLVVADKGTVPTGAAIQENMKPWGYAISCVVNGVEYLPKFLNEYFTLPAAAKPAYNSATTPRGAPVYISWDTNGKVDEFRIYKGRGGRDGTYGLLTILPGDYSTTTGTRQWTDDGSLTVDFSVPPPQGGRFPGTNIEANGGSMPAWATSTMYQKGDRVYNGTHVYEAVNTGKSFSSAGPVHTTGEWTDVGTHGPWLFGVERISFGIGDLFISNGRLYTVTTGGTATILATPGTGPYQTNTGIAEGTIRCDYTAELPAVVRWKYLGEVGRVLNEYPGVVTFVDQRLVFANSLNHPAHIWGSEVGNYPNFFDYHLPTSASDPYDFDLAYNQFEEIRGFIPAPKAFMAMTSAVEWALTGGAGDTVTATNINAKANSQRGCDWLDPKLIGNAGVFVQNRLARVRELVFDFYTQSYGGNDLSMLSQHLFDGFALVDWTYVKLPFSTIWAVRSDGKMLACTYIREQEFVSWHQHDTAQGLDYFEQVCTVSEQDPFSDPGVYVDAMYVVVKRGSARYVERFLPRFLPRNADGTWNTVDGVFADSAVIYHTNLGGTVGTLATQGDTVFTGLGHLEGRSVTVLIDGNVYGPYMVGSGQINVAAACPDGVQFKAIIGLPIYADMEFLPPKIPGQDIKRSNVKLLPRISFEVADSRGTTSFGPDYGHLKEWRQRDVRDAYGIPVAFTGLGHVRLTGVGYDHDVTLCIRQSDPLPINLLAIEREIDVGGD
jgi:hypothetical protein